MGGGHRGRARLSGEGSQIAQGAQGGRRRRPDESMSLLVDLSASSLDPGYAEAAARRAEGGSAAPAAGPTRARPRVALAGGVPAATLLIVIAAVQAHRRAPAAGRTRADLAAT